MEEPKVENEGTIEEELNVHSSPTPVERKSPTSRISKVEFFSLTETHQQICLLKAFNAINAHIFFPILFSLLKTKTCIVV